jgi:hypothetical protein
MRLEQELLMWGRAREGIYGGVTVTKSHLRSHMGTYLWKLRKIYTYMKEILMEPPNSEGDNVQTRYLMSPCETSSTRMVMQLDSYTLLSCWPTGSRGNSYTPHATVKVIDYFPWTDGNKALVLKTTLIKHELVLNKSLHPYWLVFTATRYAASFQRRKVNTRQLPTVWPTLSTCLHALLVQ